MKRRTLASITLIIAATVTVLATGCGGSQTSATDPLPLIGSATVSATNNALVASYSLSVPAGASTFIQFGPDTHYGLETSSQPSPAGGGVVKFFVAGMRASTLYHMQAVASLPDGTIVTDSDHTFKTGALSAGQSPSLTVTTAPGATPRKGVELLDLVNVNASPALTLVATDLSGNVIWYCNVPPGDDAQPAKLLPDGNFLINYAVGAPDGLNSVLEEVDLAGDVVWQMTAADLNQALAAAGYDLSIVGTHHDVAVLPNGHLILIASMIKNFTNLPGFPGTTAVTGDVLIDLDQNRNPVWTWSEFDHLDVNRHPMEFPDWTHTNAVLYSPSDGDLLISIRHQHWVLKVDYQDGRGSGAVVWKLGWQGDFTLQGGTDPQDWFYAQHGPQIVGPDSSGTFQIVLFDNGDNRVLDANGDVCGSLTPCTSTVPLIQIDETAKTATILGRDKLTPTYSDFGGNAEILANGNWEFDECAPTPITSPSAWVLEVTPDSSHQTVWSMQIGGQYAYRAFRMPSLYPGVQW
jgi:arylsulfate sulfotransferase